MHIRVIFVICLFLLVGCASKGSAITGFQHAMTDLESYYPSVFSSKHESKSSGTNRKLLFHVCFMFPAIVNSTPFLMNGNTYQEVIARFDSGTETGVLKLLYYPRSETLSATLYAEVDRAAGLVLVQRESELELKNGNQFFIARTKNGELCFNQMRSHYLHSYHSSEPLDVWLEGVLKAYTPLFKWVEKTAETPSAALARSALAHIAEKHWRL